MYNSLLITLKKKKKGGKNRNRAQNYTRAREHLEFDPSRQAFGTFTRVAKVKFDSWNEQETEAIERTKELSSPVFFMRVKSAIGGSSRYTSSAIGKIAFQLLRLHM